MADDIQPQPVKKGRSKLMAALKPVAIVAVVVVVECVAAAFLLPTMAETEKLGEKLAAARLGEPATEDASSDALEGAETMPDKDIREVSLGSYHIAVFQPKSGTTLRIDLELYGMVLADDVSAFEQLYPLHEHRLSEQVHATFRAAEITDLTDAGLGLIKRQISEKSNRTLGKPLLKDVVFSKFSFLEQ